MKIQCKFKPDFMKRNFTFPMTSMKKGIISTIRFRALFKNVEYFFSSTDFSRLNIEFPQCEPILGKKI